MAVIGLITNSGLTESISAANNEGWYIFPLEFAVAETKGTLSAARDLASMEPTWYNAPISGKIDMSPYTIQFNCDIPPNQSASPIEIQEIYLTAQDMLTNDFLLFLGQPENPVIYDPTGSTKFRLQVSITNVDISSNYIFNYTQANEISDHNVDPNAHANIFKSLPTYLRYVIADTDVQPGEILYVDTSINPINITSILTPISNTYFEIHDINKNATTNKITVLRNGSLIDGLADDYELDLNGGAVEFRYDGTSGSWWFKEKIRYDLI